MDGGNGDVDGGDGVVDSDGEMGMRTVMVVMGKVMISQITWEYSKALVVHCLAQRLLYIQSY